MAFHSVAWLIGVLFLAAATATGWCAMLKFAMQDGQFLELYRLRLQIIYDGKRGRFWKLAKTAGLCIKCHAAIPAAACVLFCYYTNPGFWLMAPVLWVGATGLAGQALDYLFHHQHAPRRVINYKPDEWRQ